MYNNSSINKVETIFKDTENQKEFSPQYSLVIRGIAVLFLICHHLLNSKYEFISILPANVIRNLSSLGKVCVAIFFILSGYGLYRSYWRQKNKSVLKFISQHIVKLLTGFWIIYILFVSMGYFFGRYPSTIYGDHLYINFLIDFFGGATLFGTPTMNPTWWYLDFILLFYLISPLVFRIIKKFSKYIIYIFFAIAAVSMFYYGFKGILIYFVPYLLGAVLSEINFFEKIHQIDKKFTISILFIVLSFIIIYIRQIIFLDDIKFYKLDWILGISIIYLTYRYINLNSIIAKGLSILGENSLNIFLFHSFLYSFYFHDIIYGMKYAIIIYVAFIAICLVVSLLLEFLKNKIRITKFCNKIANHKYLSNTLVISWLTVLFCAFAPYGVSKLGIGQFTITTAEAPIKVGNSRRIKYENLTVCNDYSKPFWTSSNPEVMIVSKDGVITALEPGEADIYINLGLKKYKYNISVIP